MNYKLKACPFCGSENIEFTPAEWMGWYYFNPAVIECKGCGIRKISHVGLKNDEFELCVEETNKALIKFWNREK